MKRSYIHGWGLFARVHFAKDDMIVEYIGEKVRQAVADRREVQYELEGVGSWYVLAYYISLFTLHLYNNLICILVIFIVYTCAILAIYSGAIKMRS